LDPPPGKDWTERGRGEAGGCPNPLREQEEIPSLDPPSETRISDDLT